MDRNLLMSTIVRLHLFLIEQHVSFLLVRRALQSRQDTMLMFDAWKFNSESFVPV